MRFFSRSPGDELVDKELRAHLEEQTAEYVAAGMPVEVARRRARLEFGGVVQVREAVHDARRGAWFEILLRDLRHAVRSLIASPAFTGAAVLSLGLGIGANTAIFSMVDTFMLKPLPVNDPDALTFLAFSGAESAHLDKRFSGDEFREIQRNRSLLLAMSVLPLVFLVQPLVAVLGLSARAAGALRDEHVLLYLLGMTGEILIVSSIYFFMPAVNIRYQFRQSLSPNIAQPPHRYS